MLESVKAASDLYTPLSGEIVAINETLEDAPEAVNDDAYSAWLFKLQPDNPADVDELLLSADAYANLLSQED